MTEHVLRAAMPSDLKWIYAWSIDDYFVGRRFGIGDDLPSFLASVRRTVMRHWVVERRNVAVGQVMLYAYNPAQRVAQFAVDILPDARGQGLARYAGAQALRACFDSIPLRKVYCHQLIRTDAVPPRDPSPECAVEARFPDYEVVGGAWYSLLIWGIYPRGAAPDRTSHS